MSTEEFETKSLPKEEWNAKRNSLNGDKTGVGHKFVSVGVSFGSRMIVQDGKTSFNVLI